MNEFNNYTKLTNVPKTLDKKEKINFLNYKTYF